MESAAPAPKRNIHILRIDQSLTKTREEQHHVTVSRRAQQNSM
jgi:hypothetical protein